jgi:PDZ domain-containing protein
MGVAIALGAGGFGYGWETQSGYYAILPDPAHPTSEVVHAKGGEPPQGDAQIYFVDVSVLKANEIQKLWAEHLVDGADLVPATQILAPGQSEQQRIRVNDRMMADSKTTAKIVAEKALGLPVKIDRKGAQVVGTQNGLPAAKAGVKPGDVIVAVQGKPITGAQGAIDVLSKLKPGDPVTLEFSDGKVRRMVTVASPDDATRAIVGVQIGDAIKVGRPPVPVTISTPGIGGPSAGLAFSLEIYDSLSHRRLLDGHKVAVTGELDLDGGVHGIGGVQQKTIGAIDAGADAFIVPKGDNERDARKAADGRIRIIGVSTFDQALAAIRGLPPM